MTEPTPQPTPAPEPASTARPVWQIIVISTVVSTIVSITTVFAYTKLKPEPEPEPTVTEQFFEGIGDLFGAIGEVDGESLQMMGEFGGLLGGGGSMGDLEQLMQMAEMALGGAEMLEGLAPNDGLGSLDDLDRLLEDSLGQMEEAFMEGLQSGLGDMMGSLNELEEGLGSLDLSGLLGGFGHVEEVPATEGWEAAPGDDSFDGLEALDRLLEGQ